jgi:hypothetical protein
MPTLTASFRACAPAAWSGRYARIPGEGTVFHLRFVDGELWPVIIWKTEDGKGTCKALRCDAAADLSHAVRRAKLLAGGTGGGEFLINEAGQVLVPASDGKGRRYLAGELQGKLLFENPFARNDPIDLWDSEHLQPGDPWKLPYLGIPYHLHRGSYVYFYRTGKDRAGPDQPAQQDSNLIRSLREVRPRGPVRFIVNPAGIVLTKCPIDSHWTSEEFWRPVFIGSISLTHWFAKE